MKTKKIIFGILLVSLFYAFNPNTQKVLIKENADVSVRNINNHAYAAGEKLVYRLHYGVISAGTATLEINKMDKKIAGRDIYHIVGTGKSKGAFDWFFKVRDRYETFMDVNGAFPWAFVRNVSEGGYKINQQYKFFQNKNKIDNGKGKTFDAPAGIQDMLSSFYYARTIDYTNAKDGEIFTIWSFVDDKIWPLKIRFKGRETIKVSGKKYRAMKFHPVIQTGRLFKHEEDVTVWISDDANKIPLLAEGKVMVGAVKMELTKATGLANPSAIVQ